VIRYNRSRVLQIAEQGGRSKRLLPGWAIDGALEEGRIVADPEAVGFANSPTEIFNKIPQMQFGVARRGGTGDIIMLLPVLRVLMKCYPQMTVHLFTVDKHVNLLKPSETRHFKVHTEHETRTVPLDFGMSLEGVVEKDHAGRGNRYEKMGRHLIYAEALGILRAMRAAEHEQDFSIVTTDADKRRARAWTNGINRPLIAVQVRGNETSRALPFDRIVAIVRYLTRAGFAVYPADHQFFAKLRGDNVFQFPQATFREIIEILKHCKFIVSMESSFLHLAHVVNRPVICFYGPTRIQERGAFHPSYDRGWVIPIELNREFNCEPCFFSFAACRGQLKCMRNVPIQRIVERVDWATQRMLSILDHSPASA